MDTTSNRDTVETSDSGLTPRTIPGGCKDAQNGVSVRNMPERKDGFEWYVFRASYGRAVKATDHLTTLGATSYIPLHTVIVVKGGKRKRATAPLIPGIVFAYLTGIEAELFAKGPNSSSCEVEASFNSKNTDERTAIGELNKILSYYYDHFSIDEQTGNNPPLTIPYGDMQNFIYATSAVNDVMPVTPGTISIGEEVKVIEGEFAGLVGKVIEKNNKRLKVRFSNNDGKDKQQPKPQKRRLLFHLPCLGSFSSASIPVEYFSKIE